MSPGNACREELIVNKERTSQGAHLVAKAGTVVVTIGVAVGLAAMPYGYYMLLRFVLCAFSVFVLFGARFHLAGWERWTLGATAILYNPLLPVRIGDKDIWIVLNIASLVLFWAVVGQRMRRQST